jgi:hypothetical protein
VKPEVERLWVINQSPHCAAGEYIKLNTKKCMATFTIPEP